MDDRVLFRLEFKMRDIEIADGVQGGDDGAFALGTGTRGAQFAPELAERTQHARAIETLTFTMFAEAHTRILRGDEPRTGLGAEHSDSPVR